MKRHLILIIAIFACAISSFAQKYAMVDMEYVLRNIPSYEMANEQLNQLSLRYQREVEAVGKEAETMYQNFLADKVFMTDDQIKASEAKIVAKEKEATDLRNKYFGPEGELYKKRVSLLKPIQDEVYEAIKSVAQQRGYLTIFDRASSSSIIYSSPTIDISNEVLNKMGFGK